MTKPDAPTQGSSHDLLARLEADVATLDLELAEVDMLLGQVRSESVRHEQKRAQAADKLGQSDRKGERGEQADAYAQLVALTRRAAVMDAQASILESKRRSLVRHRDAIAAIAAEVAQLDPSASAAAPGGASEEVLTPPLTRVVLVAQEDLRREIARAMHDGPAQSLTNIVLQAAIVERLLNRDPANAKGELRQLVSMVQQTLDATKTFIFDVRPMVLDDLGLVPTMRRAARDRGRRSHVPVEFDSLGMDIRLPMEVESAVFRILDEALAGYLSLNPDQVTLRLDWGDVLEARIGAHRAVAAPVESEPLPQVPAGGDVPDAIKQMIQDRHDKRQAAVEEAEAAAIVVLPSATRRDVTERATSIGGTVEILAGGSELRLVVPLPAAGEPGPAA